MLCVAVLFVVYISSVSCTYEGNLGLHPGHQKPFGRGGPFLEVWELSEFPGPREFYQEYVEKKMPFVVRGGAKTMAAIDKWTDTYLQGKHNI